MPTGLGREYTEKEEEAWKYFFKKYHGDDDMGRTYKDVQKEIINLKVIKNLEELEVVE